MLEERLEWVLVFKMMMTQAKLADTCSAGLSTLYFLQNTLVLLPSHFGKQSTDAWSGYFQLKYVICNR
jgi:hypothetical protein